MQKLLVLVLLCAACGDSPRDVELLAAYRACLKDPEVAQAPARRSPITLPRRPLFALDDPDYACRQMVANTYHVPVERLQALQ